MPTLKQKLAVNKLVENGGNVSKTMKDAGYKETTAHTPKKLTESKGFKEAAQPLIEQLEKERQAILKEMKKKRSKANYGTLAGAFDTVTKNIQLLKGDATENTHIQIISNIPRGDNKV